MAIKNVGKIANKNVPFPNSNIQKKFKEQNLN